jgi:hypothetical protein
MFSAKVDVAEGHAARVAMLFYPLNRCFFTLSMVVFLPPLDRPALRYALW